MLDITCYDGNDDQSGVVLNLSTITIVETTSEPDASGSLVTVRDIAGNLYWGFKGSSSDGDAWLNVSRCLDQPSSDYDYFRSDCERVMEEFNG